nr:receptor-like protein kinase 5 [Tanacetum cinerariifolium]
MEVEDYLKTYSSAEMDISDVYTGTMCGFTVSLACDSKVMKGLFEYKASESNVRRIQVKDIVKEVEDHLKTYSSARMDISLLRKWLSMNQTRGANNSIKKDSLAALYGKYHYEEGKGDKGKSYKGLIIESFDWDDESVSSEDEGTTKFKAFMAIAKDEPSVGKSDARSGQWVEITMKKVHRLLSMTEEPSDASKRLISLSDLTANMADLTLNTASKEIKKSSNKVSQTYVIKKKAEPKHLAVQTLSPDKNAFPSTEQLLLTLMEEVKGRNMKAIREFDARRNFNRSSGFYIHSFSVSTWMWVFIGLDMSVKSNNSYDIVSIAPHVISQPTTNQNDQSTLLNIKRFWSNPPSLSHWNQSSNPCTWPEIICTANTVTGITIRQDIPGLVPPFICDIKNLTHLDLSWNLFNGNFPTPLYNCTNLQYLDLSSNYFVGKLPDDISRLSPELKYFNLLGDNFTGDIPVNISRLSKLTFLELRQNLFNGTFPEEIGDLSDLEELYLGFNDFKPSRLPDSFTRLKKLRNFIMTEANLIGEIPGNLSGMAAMELLDLSVNRLEGSIPSDLFLLKNLTQVYLYGNNLTGAIPDSIEAWNLEIMDLSANKLTGKIPDGFGNLTSLTNLTLLINRLSGEIPVGIGRLPKLNDVRIFRNKLSGQLPPDFGRHSELKIFEVFENNFTGNLPSNLCYSGKLKGVSVHTNNLSGEIPKSLETCNTLKTVELYGNRFSGVFPDGLWKVSRLEKLMISGNSFTGELPQELAPNLSTLEIKNNQFSGQIPIGVSTWKNLQAFKASYNFFNGVIPQGLTALPNLGTLEFDGNQLTGELPATIVSWSSLSTLNLSRNQLSGPIPAGLGFLKRLTVLDLSRNYLSGQIPSQLGRQLVSLDLSGNNLTGILPNQLDNGAFDKSFLNNPGLCSNNPSIGLSSCISRSNSDPSRKISAKFVAIIASIAVIMVLLALLMTGYVIVLYRRKKYDLDMNWKFTSFQKLSFTESTILPRLTENNVIGHGGSGKVYRVPVNRSGDVVAVKKISSKKDLDPRHEKQFLAEVQILSTIRHSNIVKLMGCISCDNSKLLVYEYLENRSLDRWLHRKQTPSGRGPSGSVRHVVLDWPKRSQIALGAARGLSYMHHDCTPESAHTTKVNEKIDIYSFGVVLLELTTGKEASNGDEHSSLAEWAWQHALGGAPIADALDDDVNEPIYLNDMLTVFKLGLCCTSKLPTNRPFMKEVCEMLLRCSQASEAARKEKNRGDVADHLPLLELEDV